MYLSLTPSTDTSSGGLFAAARHLRPLLADAATRVT